MQFELLESSVVNTYKNGEHTFSVEMSQVKGRDPTFRVETLENQCMVSPSEVPEKIVNKETLTSIINDLHEKYSN